MCLGLIQEITEQCATGKDTRNVLQKVTQKRNALQNERERELGDLKLAL